MKTREQFDIEKMVDCGRNLKELTSSLSQCRYDDDKGYKDFKQKIERASNKGKCILLSPPSSDGGRSMTAGETVGIWLQANGLMNERGQYYYEKWRLDRIAIDMFLGNERENELCDDIQLFYGSGSVNNEASLFLSTLAVIAMAGAAMYDSVGRDNMDPRLICLLFNIPVREARRVMEFIELYCGYRHIYRVPQLLGVMGESVDPSDELGGSLRTDLASQVLVIDDVSKQSRFRISFWKSDTEKESMRLIPPRLSGANDSDKIFDNARNICKLMDSVNLVWQLMEILDTPMDSEEELNSCRYIGRLLDELTPHERFCYDVIMHVGSRTPVISCYELARIDDKEYYIKSIRQDIYMCMEDILYDEGGTPYKGINLSNKYLSAEYGEAMNIEVPSHEKICLYIGVILKYFSPATSLEKEQTSFKNMKTIIDWSLTLPYSRREETDDKGDITVSYPQFGIRISGEEDSRDLLYADAREDLRSLFVSLMVRDMRIPLPVEM